MQILSVTADIKYNSIERLTYDLDLKSIHLVGERGAVVSVAPASDSIVTSSSGSDVVLLTHTQCLSFRIDTPPCPSSICR
jgi:hypothetical protein